MDDEPAQVLSIGIIVGGSSPASKTWTDALQRLSRRVIAAREGVTSPLNVNVVFHVPGHLVGPDYEGVRTGTFRRRTSHLMVQVAVPKGMPENADAFARASLAQALDAAEAWAVRRRIAAELPALRGIARRAAADA